MQHVIPERQGEKNTKNKKTAFENMKVNRSDNVSSKGKRKKLFFEPFQFGIEPEEDIKGHFLRDKTQIKGKNRGELKCTELSGTGKSAQRTQGKQCRKWHLRGGEHQSCNVFAIAFSYNGGYVHLFPKERPTQGFLIFCSHIAWRETSCQKTIKNHFKK